MSDIKTVHNIFFKGPEGYKEHLQLEGTSPESVVQEREGILKFLTDIGATPEYPAQQQRPPQAARPAGGGGTPQPYPSQMERAAREAFPGAQVQMECKSGCGPMRYVKGTAENGGKLSKRGLPYSSFWSCPTCHANVNI